MVFTTARIVLPDRNYRNFYRLQLELEKSYNARQELLISSGTSVSFSGGRDFEALRATVMGSEVTRDGATT